MIPRRISPDQVRPVQEFLSVSREIVLTTHHRPDGDAMGSSLGLYNYLIKKGHKVQVICPSDYPDFLYWLPGNSSVLIYENAKTKCDDVLNKADLIFCLDFNWMNRVEKMEEVLRLSKGKKVLIDHHLDPENAYDIVYSFSDACSTSELIYDLIAALDDADLIDKQIAECLYCGIMTDTNSFRYSSMKARTHRIIAYLMEAGAENYRIHELVYDTSTESKTRLLGYALSQKLFVLKEYNTAYIVLSAEELLKFNYKTGDTEGLVNYALGIENIKLAAFFTERDEGIKISFRSKGNFSVKELASAYFTGGGHRNASGGFSTGTLQETVKKFLDVLPLYKNRLI